VFNPHYCSKLDMRIMSQNIHEFFDKCVVFSNTNFVHNNNILENTSYFRD